MGIDLDLDFDCGEGLDANNTSSTRPSTRTHFRILAECTPGRSVDMYDFRSQKVCVQRFHQRKAKKSK